MAELKVSVNDFIHKHNNCLRDAYRFDLILSESSYGNLRKVTQRITQELRVLKTVPKTPEDTDENLRAFLHEIEMLRNLDHPSILKLYKFY